MVTNSLDEKEYASKTFDVLASAGIVMTTGVPIPPSIIKSIRKATDKLIGSVTDLGVSYIDTITENRKVINDGKNHVLNETAKATAQVAIQDKAMMDRAIELFASDLLDKQRNKEAVMKFAVEELNNGSFSVNPEDTIEDDWLSTFSSLASQKSDKDVQFLLGKILAGEIRNPGSFSPMSLHILSTLTRDVAKYFESFCNLTIMCDLDDDGGYYGFIWRDSYPQYGVKGIPEYDLNFGMLMVLKSYGLIDQIDDVNLTPHELLSELKVIIGNKSYNLVSKSGAPISLRIAPLAPLTMAGNELRRVLSLEPTQKHIDVMLESFSKIGFELKDKI